MNFYKANSLNKEMYNITNQNDEIQNKVIKNVARYPNQNKTRSSKTSKEYPNRSVIKVNELRRYVLPAFFLKSLKSVY